MQRHEIVICGAGITGIAAAYYLSKQGTSNVLLVDERPPLTLTSDRSTECYRNWWPDPAMLGMMNHSIDLMEGLADQTNNVFHLNRRGYLYLTADAGNLPDFKARAERIAGLGGGSLRIHEVGSSSYVPAQAEGYRGQPTGADLLLDTDLIRRWHPGTTPAAVAALHVRRAGWLSAQQLGMYLLQSALQRGVRFQQARLAQVDVQGNHVRSVRLSSGENVACQVFVNAAGPFLCDIGRLLGVELPVDTELHLKAAVNDTLGVVDRNAPVLIWDDPQILPWNAAEHAVLASDPQTRWLTEPLPSGAHVRPEGGEKSQSILMLWEYRRRKTPPRLPPEIDQEFPELALRGLVALLPGMAAYLGRLPRPQLDGGYYTKTRENRPLIGPLEVKGAYVLGAVSGFGIMSACAAGELLAAHIGGGSLPEYAAAFAPSRYQDSTYLRQVEGMVETGQL
jgi:glycine/D-amino acid oxidase-like deaminating enzyme